MNCKLTFIWIVLLSFSAYGQYSIKGTVRDYTKRAEISACNVISDPYVTIALENMQSSFLSKERKPVRGTMTNSKGEFQLDSIPSKKANLLLSFIGFEKMIIYNIPLKRNRTVDLGDIYMLMMRYTAGMNNYFDGVITDRDKKVNTTVLLDYPPSGKKVKVKVEKDCIYINFKELIHSR